MLDLSIKKKAKKLSGKYDVCIAYAEGNCAKLIQNINCKRKLIWIHNDYNFVPQAGEDTKFELFDRICCVSESTRLAFIKKYPNIANRTTTIYNLINHQSIKQLANEKINDINFTNNNFSIMSIGRICQQKQFTIIPDIAKRLADKFKFKWYIIGDGPEKNKLERKIEQFDLQENIILLGKQDNPYKYLAQARVLGIPIISNDIPSIHEMIDKTQGVIAPVENWEGILCKIIDERDSNKHRNNVDFESFNQDVMKKFYELIKS